MLRSVVFYNSQRKTRTRIHTVSSQTDMTSSWSVIQSPLATTATKAHDCTLVYQDPCGVWACVCFLMGDLWVWKSWQLYPFFCPHAPLMNVCPSQLFQLWLRLPVFNFYPTNVMCLFYCDFEIIPNKYTSRDLTAILQHKAPREIKRKCYWGLFHELHTKDGHGMMSLIGFGLWSLNISILATATLGLFLELEVKARNLG